MFWWRAAFLFEPIKVIAVTLRDYLRIDRYICAVIVVFALLYVPTIPRATDNAILLATATNDDPWMTMALDGTLAFPFGNPANYFDPREPAHDNIPSRWDTLRYDGIVYYGGAAFMIATPFYAVARFAGLPPFPTAPIILRIISVLGGLLSLIVLYNFVKQFGAKWAGLLCTVYLMTDDQFGLWTRMAHPDTLQVFFGLIALVIAVRHSYHGDCWSLVALGLFCGFVQGAKAGGAWTIPMATLAMVWGLQSAEHRFFSLKPLLQRATLLGCAALFGYFVSTPYAFTNSYLLRLYREVWKFQGLGGTGDGPFGRVTLWTWAEAIYTHIGPLATALFLIALVRAAVELFRTPVNRPVLLATVLSVSQIIWYVGFGKLWVVVGYLVLAGGLMAALAFDSCIVLLRSLLQLGVSSMRVSNLSATKFATIAVVSIAVVLGAPRVLQGITVMLLLASHGTSTQVAVNAWAIENRLPRNAKILYDDAAYFDPTRFPNAISHPKPTWGTIDSNAPDYLVLSSSIHGAPHYKLLMENQRLRRSDPLDFVTGGYSVRVYQDLLQTNKFGPTALPGIEYIAVIKEIPAPFSAPTWKPPLQSPPIDWVFNSIWWSDYWLRYASALVGDLWSSDNQPRQGPTFHIYRIRDLPKVGRVRYARSCDEVDRDCIDFTERLIQGEKIVVNFDGCLKNIGTIACGKSYTIRYWRKGGAWCSSVSGPKIGSPIEIKDFSECIVDPQQGSISIFSVPFVYNDKGEIFQLSSGAPPALVGHMEH